ncbi:hypothetical protein D9611_003167 [Ephemerocybe angulata]|uniref:Tail specific protease domain-containing protein n=1 Tax=Ephemerocybe angulata TaxID=980116 RepID=A0A8H5FI65_9AGAR|nr:hypothetical protein D9611_003167 [Tulosesus angulatus]
MAPMALLPKVVLAAVLAATAVQAVPQDVSATSAASKDPCAKIGGQKWVAPADVRACFTSYKVDETVKSNIIEVINKTLAFHTSTSYQIRAPGIFASEVHVNVPQELARIKKQSYRSEYDLHVDLSRTLKRLNDGHATWTFGCYSIHISPEAFKVASAEFPDQIDVWQNALPFSLKGKLESFAGAKVLAINGKNPWDAVSANSAIAGSYQALGTRQNGFFSSYQRSTSSWNYLLGNFAQQSLPLSDSVLLTVQRTGHILPDIILLPYRSRISSSSTAFTDTASWRSGNCVAKTGTNGADINDSGSMSALTEDPTAQYEQQPTVPPTKKQLLNVMYDDSPLSNVVLPQPLQPSLPAINGSRSVGQFYMLKDGKTGVLALGSFSDDDYDEFLRGLLVGLLNLKSLGASQLVVDVSNNGGGYICAAHWLHRIIAGPKGTTEPQAGLDTKARAGPLAQAIVDELNKNPELDPTLQLNYNPLNWRSENNEFFAKTTNWLRPVVNSVINGVPDAFSPRLGQECQPEGFSFNPPNEALFDPKKVVIVSNGRCASSCSLFSITMAKKEGSKTVVLGGKYDVKQEYCGVVGGQSTNFKQIDTEIKTTKLKDHELAPPDLLVNGGQGITWRLAFGVTNTAEPEEWQDHPADLNLPITAALVNNPVAIWETVVAKLLA